MSKGLNRTYSLRKPIRPKIESEEDDDDQRRDSFGRKRVDVVHCLFDSSSDENDDENLSIEKCQSILWLTFNEICHIRYVLTRSEKSTISSRNMCFRCGKKFHSFLFSPLIYYFLKTDICYICQQTMCKKCVYTKFSLPTSNFTIPIRIQTLIKPSAINIDNQIEEKQNHTEGKTICYDCLQIFNEYKKTSNQPINQFRRTLSLPSASRKKKR